MPRAFRFAPLVCLVVAGCAASRPAPRSTVPEPPRNQEVDHAAYETFDPSGLGSDVPAAAPVAEHDVPADLMAGRAEAAAPPPPVRPPVATPARPTTPGRPAPTTYRTVSGYRVQVFQSPSKAEADQGVARAIAWWRRSQSGSPEIYTVYRAPYYRVRVGNYASRQAANRAVLALQGTFPNAFPVQDRVTVPVLPPPTPD